MDEKFEDLTLGDLFPMEVEDLVSDNLLPGEQLEKGMVTYYEGNNSGSGGQTVLKITTNGSTTFSSEVLEHIMKHSPDGFQWGYGGSGVSDLAFSILMDCCGDGIAERLYQQFKWDFLAKLGDHLLIYQSVIWEWVLEQTGVENE